MEWKDYFNNVLKGVVGAIAVVTVLTAILSLVMSFVDISSGMFSAIYVVITSISLIFGTIFAAKLYGHKGWLVGLSVGVLFYISLYAIGVLFGAEATLGLYDIIVQEFSESIQFLLIRQLAREQQHSSPNHRDIGCHRRRSRTVPLSVWLRPWLTRLWAS